MDDQLLTKMMTLQIMIKTDEDDNEMQSINLTCLSDMSEQKLEEEIGKKKYEEDDEYPATGRGWNANNTTG